MLIVLAQVHREGNGVIHIHADNVHDMYFAQGVATAQVPKVIVVPHIVVTTTHS